MGMEYAGLALIAVACGAGFTYLGFKMGYDAAMKTVSFTLKHSNTVLYNTADEVKQDMPSMAQVAEEAYFAMGETDIPKDMNPDKFEEMRKKWVFGEEED